MIFEMLYFKQCIEPSYPLYIVCMLGTASRKERQEKILGNAYGQQCSVRRAHERLPTIVLFDARTAHATGMNEVGAGLPAKVVPHKAIREQARSYRLSILMGLKNKRTS